MSLNPSLSRPVSRRPVLHAMAGAAALLAMLTACGGGGGDTTPAPAPDPAPASLDLSGTAAVGRALAGATITAKCATGTSSATAGTDGSYSLRISGGALPCVLQAVSGTTTLHSVATGTGRSATANITPLTELVVAQANSGDAAALFSSFDAAAQAKVSSAALATATTSVQTALASVVDIAGVNPFTDTLVAATGTATGNALDAKLDTLGSKLGAAKVTLAELISTIARNGSAAATVVSSQVQPATSHCASLRSGTYTMIDPGAGTAALRARRVTIDAAALTLRDADGTVHNAASVTGKPCHFTSDAGSVNTVVSPAGVLVHHIVPGDGSGARVAVSLPTQAIAPAQLAGTWNTVEFGLDNGSNQPAVNSYANVVVDATGKLTTISDCQFLQPCTPQTSAPPNGFLAGANGDLIVNDTDGSAGRFFAYRAPSGDMVLVGLPASGIIIAARQAALALPVVGETQTYWDVAINSSLVAGDLIADVRTITAVDAAAGTYSRSASYTGFTDSIQINKPRPGMRVRESCTSSTGAVSACGLISMPLPGMGITVHGRSSASTGGGLLDIAVLRPAGSTAKGVQATGTSTTNSAGTTVPGTLVVNGGETYPLRASLTVSGAGQITGGQYDFHKLSGTMTPCTYSVVNASTCFGTSGSFNNTSQGGPISGSGSATGIRLVAGPDSWGYTYTGTLSGVRWTGTWTKVATANSAQTGSGSFAVDLVITQP